MSSRPRYTNLVKGRYWRFRHPLIGNVALPGQPGEPQFHRAYADLLDKVGKAPKPDRAATGTDTLRHLALSFEKSPEFRQLKPNTQRDYARILAVIVEAAGGIRYETITRAGAVALRNRFSDTPRKANYVVQVLSLLLTWAVDQGMLSENKVLGTKKLKLNGKGYKPWSEPEIAKFLAEAKPHIRLGVVLGLFTGQRLGDVVIMERERYLGGEIECRQNKTKELLPIACAEALRAELDARPFPDASTLLVNEKGESFPSEGAFSNALKREVRRIGLSDELSFHGIRYAAAARLEEAGATLGVIQALIGHRTYQMAVQYATKRRGAAEAARLLDASEQKRKVKTSRKSEN